MAKKKQSLIEFELQDLEGQLSQLKEYLDKRPFGKLKDRFNPKSGAVVASVEDQRKDLTAAMKDYASLCADIRALREIEEAKKDDIRGDQDLSPLEDGQI